MLTVDNDGLLVIDKVEARAIDEFKAIITRDKNRAKPTAFAELLYIYLMYNPESSISDLHEKNRKTVAAKMAKLGEDWTPDNVVKEAEEKYSKEILELDAMYYSYISARRSLRSVGEDIDLFNNQKEKLRIKLISIQNKITEFSGTGEELSELVKKEAELTGRLMSLTQNIQKLVEGLNNNYSTVENLKKHLAKEKDKGSAIRGGGEVGNREE